MSRLINESILKDIQRDSEFKEFAYDLRKEVTSCARTKLPDKLSVEDVMHGECEIPTALYEFMSHLIQRPNWRRKHNDNDNEKVKSLCYDIIYAITRGRVRPSKQLT